MTLKKKVAAVASALAVTFSGVTVVSTPAAIAQESQQGNFSDACKIEYSAVGELDTSKATDIGSLTGFKINANPNEYGDASAQVQHWGGGSPTHFWRIPFGTAEPLENVVMTMTLPAGFTYKLNHDDHVLVHFSKAKNPDYGVENVRDNGGYELGGNSHSTQSEPNHIKWSDAQAEELDNGRTKLTMSIPRMDAGTHTVIQPELKPIAGFDYPDVTEVDVSITADRSCAIDGRAFNDTNADGKWGPGELPRTDLPVYLLDSNGEIVDETVTNHTGQYRFGEVDSGTYNVKFARPEGLPGYVFTNGEDSEVNAEGVTEDLSFDNDTPRFGTDREHRGIDAGIAQIQGKPSYDDSYTSPGVPVEVNQTGDVFVPPGSTYSIPEDSIKEGWEVDIDAETGRLTVTPPADAQPNEKHEIPVTVTLPNGEVYAETTARVEVDARINRFYVNDDGDLIVVWNYNGEDGEPFEENLGQVKGDKGDDGEKGDKGDEGRGVEKTEIIDGELIITYTDGTTENLGRVTGEDGQDGKDGLSSNLNLPGSSGNGSGQSGSSDARCVKAASTVGVPLLALLPIGLATQLNIPGLSQLMADAQAQLASYNADVQQQLGIYDERTAKFMAQVNTELNKNGGALGKAVGVAAVIAIGGLVGKYLYDSCVPKA